ncbi:MAG TPA: cyclic-phosphate processing receiver domain-containing protein [Polyangiaceae bacterium]|nr:cyclic-phosphate processing receiver domain-containing protein [Polyangiaceae bacterium]
MKVFLDDQRPAPKGWILARSADEAIDWLRRGEVTELSLDYDLGDPHFGTGLVVLDWLETALSEGRLRLPRLVAHSGSPLGRRRLEHSIALLEERWG